MIIHRYFDTACELFDEQWNNGGHKNRLTSTEIRQSKGDRYRF